MDYQAMKEIVEKIDNQELLLKYCLAVGEIEEADKHKKSIFDSLINEQNYQQALNFADKYQMHIEIKLAQDCLHEQGCSEYDHFCRNKNYYQAMETAKKYALGADMVEKSALAFFEEKIADSKYDRAIIVMVAENHLSHLPEKLTQAVRELFDQKLHNFHFAEAVGIIKEYPKLIDQNRKDLLQVLTK